MFFSSIMFDSLSFKKGLILNFMNSRSVNDIMYYELGIWKPVFNFHLIIFFSKHCILS